MAAAKQESSLAPSVHKTLHVERKWGAAAVAVAVAAHLGADTHTAIQLCELLFVGARTQNFGS